MLDARLLTFLNLCQSKSFTKTAKNLHITQPAVSHHLKYLEQFYQTKLYKYSNREFRLTPTGEILYQFVSSVYSDSEQLRGQLPLLSPEFKEFRIGAEQSAGESFLPDLIIAFMKTAAEYKIKIVIDNYSNLTHMLNRGELDFCLLDGDVSKTEHEYHELCDGNVVCVCSPAHPLAKKHMEMKAIFSSTLILGMADSPSRIRLETILRENGVSVIQFMNRIEVSNSLSVVKQFIFQNIGISFLYKSAVAKELANGTLEQICINNFYERHSYNLISMRNSYFNTSRIDFVRFCQDFLQSWETDINAERESRL